MANLNSAPRSVRLHISIFGKTNSGKSSLLNALTTHSTSLVSPVKGTTTDPVYKSIELYGLGPCVLIDTAGFDDKGELGSLRVKKTKDALKKTDLGILLFDATETNFDKEIQWAQKLIKLEKPFLAVISKVDLNNDTTMIEKMIEDNFNLKAIKVYSKQENLQHLIREELIKINKNKAKKRSIVENLVEKDDIVMLVMPQQINAPEGRLILPQVQTIRDLLDHHCVVVSVCTNEIESALKALVKPPKLIITDSQVFPLVYKKKPQESALTSFSILLSAVKGDVKKFAKAAKAIDNLDENSKVLIAEACTHAPLTEDIGRIQIPRLLRKKVGENLHIDFVSGTDFPSNLTDYNLVIHCAGCMFNRSYMLSRLMECESQGIEMTNYGICIAKLSNILDFVDY
ncbi:MAG: [FeFe] hydrogenase H-cluster maturation GTPase HydF [Sphaerochaetaceae bacterium]|nr:[FeFe] hydrogenase H-cluster maturation GTPase HydF [Sphaerochaetaceae bacterium]